MSACDAGWVESWQVCEYCLLFNHDGEEKCCSHAWDFTTRRRKRGECMECGQPSDRLACVGSHGTPPS